MRIVRFAVGGQARYGIVEETTVTEIQGDIFGSYRLTRMEPSLMVQVSSIQFLVFIVVVANQRRLGFHCSLGSMVCWPGGIGIGAPGPRGVHAVQGPHPGAVQSAPPPSRSKRIGPSPGATGSQLTETCVMRSEIP